MESFRTLYRLAVMLVALVLGYKGWQLYGPPPDRLKAIGSRALEIASEVFGAEDKARSADRTARLAADPEPMAPAAFAPPPPMTAGPVVPAQALVPNEPRPAGSETHGVASDGPARFAPPDLLPAPISTDPASGSSASQSSRELAGDDDLTGLFSRLEQLGVHQRELAKWGDSGQLYRFACQAAVGDSADFSRHFESFAGQPRAAVEEVVAKVEAWRAAQRGERTVDESVY